MNRGFLATYFDGIGVKTLSEVDSNPNRSNQHEIGITRPMRSFMGEVGITFPASFLWLGGEQESVTEFGEATYYDSRANNPNRSAEWRLYYPTNPVTEMMSAGDTLFLTLRPDRTLLFVVVPRESNIESQMLWLFDIPEQQRLQFVIREYASDELGELDFVTRYLLDEIGIEYEDPTANSLDSIIDRFGMSFPKTAVFSDLARSTLPEVSPRDNPDAALMAWLNHEEAMFRRLEKRIVSERIREGFLVDNEADVDSFIKFSLSVQNRRKSRMGHSLENHLSAIFDAHDISYSSQVRTEKGKKPDFIFPGKEEYFDTEYDVNRLTMLAAKSSCKDRWSQVLPEAERLTQKHLLTLEPAITEATTNSMSESALQLIVPNSIQDSYTTRQQEWLWSFQDFISEIIDRQVS